MKKPIIILLAAAGLLALLFAAGCGSQAAGDSGKLTSDEYGQITLGMTGDSLKSIAGEPSRTEKKNMGGGHSMGDGGTMTTTMDAEYWYYQGDKGWIRVEVADGKVTSKSGY